MSSIQSPNMSLIIPTVGTEPGPTYALDVNSSLTIIDAHNHSNGSGVQINPAGININTSLTFNNNLVTNLQGASFTLQSIVPTTPQTMYVKNGTESPTPLPDLWYYDGSNQIQITSGGTLAATPTTVAGLSYAGGTFTFVQGTGSTTPANLSIGSVTIRPNIAATTNGVILGPPSGISSAYNIQLPSVPISTSFLTIDSSGNMAPTIATANGITRNNQAAVGQQISASSGGFSTNATSFTSVTNLSVTITTTGRPVVIMMQPDTSNNGSGLFVSSSVAGAFAPASISLFRGATQIGRFITLAGFFDFPNTNFVHYFPPSIVFYLDAQTAGTYTYNVQVLVPNTTMTIGVNFCNLVAYEL